MFLIQNNNFILENETKKKQKKIGLDTVVNISMYFFVFL